MSAATNKRREIWLKLITLLLPLVYYTLPARAANDAVNLRDKGQSLAQQLNHNQFQREIYLDSTELEPTLKGEIFAVVDFPFATVNNALNDPVQGPANWCDILILHLNTKYCRASSSSKGDVLSVNIGKKVEQELVDAYRMQFAYRVAAVSAGAGA